LPRRSSSAEFQPTEELIDKGRVVREVVHDDFPGERRGGNGFEQAKIVELVSRRFAGAEHRGLAGGKITLEQGIAERKGLVETACVSTFSAGNSVPLLLWRRTTLAADDSGWGGH
jgi:hypothetical protein